MQNIIYQKTYKKYEKKQWGLKIAYKLGGTLSPACLIVSKISENYYQN